VFEGKNVNLRSLEIDDLGILKKWRNDKITRNHTREYRLLNMINQKHWFETIHKDNPPKFLMFGVTDKRKKLVGVCGLTYIDWKNRHCEISIILYLKNWQKTKEAKETISLLINYGFGELNMRRLWVEIFDTIPENIKLFESLNFHREGILRDKLWRQKKWHNSYIYSKLSTDK
jgi:RimJ/RimL family protein N-acetyltransferase|tara:strand:+ start:313 stop:834 length:522 start_codon:yes stop_codon:yes gene_type:complete